MSDILGAAGAIVVVAIGCHVYGGALRAADRRYFRKIGWDTPKEKLRLVHERRTDANQGNRRRGAP